MIDIEHCTILGGETVDANSLNRCMFNLHRKMTEAYGTSLGAVSENIPTSPFFSGGYGDMLEHLNGIDSSLGLSAATTTDEGLVPRLYCGSFNIYGSQDNPSFATESETGAYYYDSTQLSTFAPTVSALYGDSAPLILRPLTEDDESTMVTGVSSLGTASSPTIKFTSYLTCANSGVSFGTVTFSRNNGDRQRNVLTLNIPRDLIGIDGVETIDFFTIGNGFASGVRTVSENLYMVSDITQCTVTYLSDSEVAVTNITKSDNSDTLYVERDTGRISESGDSYGRYVELSNDEVVLNFFTIFTLKENALKYSDDLWCFYIVNDWNYGCAVLNDASSWARDYFRYSFDNFEVADDGMLSVDGEHMWNSTVGCVTVADDAFNGCYNATFKSLHWISPRLEYAERMFKGCTHATFDKLPDELFFPKLRSGTAMFENCMSAPFANTTTVNVSGATRVGMMFAGCSNASFDMLQTVIVGGDAIKMFYGDSGSEFPSLRSIKGSARRLVSMFEGCDNARFPNLTSVSSSFNNGEIDASRMFYGLESPEFASISSIDLSDPVNNVHGYCGASMFEGCLNATFASLTGLGRLVDGTRMFAGCDPYFSADDVKNLKHATFSSLTSLGDRIVIGNGMFRDNYFLSMRIMEDVPSLKDGDNMFTNTSSVVFEGSLDSLMTADGMFSHTMTAVVSGDMDSLENGHEMFKSVHRAEVHGDMPKLVDANSMFLSSDEVEVSHFPASVRDARSAFAHIGGYCEIGDWEFAAYGDGGRYCTNAFMGSNAVSITGDITDGDVVDTSHMFESVASLNLHNAAMGSPTEMEGRFHYTEAGEHYTYIQKFTEDGSGGRFVFVGDATVANVSSLITQSLSGELEDSMLLATTLRSHDPEYSLYSVSGNWADTAEGLTLTLNSSGIVFNDETILSSGNYFYATSGSGGDTCEVSVRQITVPRQIPNLTTTNSVTGYVVFSTHPSYSDKRMFVIETANSSALSATIRQYMSMWPEPFSPYSQGTVYADGNHFYYRNNTGNPEEVSNSGGTISWDFLLTGGMVQPVFNIWGEDGTRNVYAINMYGALGNVPADQYGRLVIENSVDRIHVEVAEVRPRSADASSDPYGYLMRYSNDAYSDYRLVFKKYGYDALYEMMLSPKREVCDFAVAQVFGDHDFGEDVPDTHDSARVHTWFSAGNADMGHSWKYAECMFLDVASDSLLSGYYCMTDTSLLDVSHMFALSEKVEGDSTFRYAGPLLQNLHDSSVTDMDGMFENRVVCEPLVFRDNYHEDGNYISFQIPVGATDAASAFRNCSISSYSEMLGESFGEIGLFIPPTLTGASEMFSGYNGPKIRFGYKQEPAGVIYIADGMDCDNMFRGCEFAETQGEMFAFSIPDIYLNMFEGSDFGMGNISSLTVRNGMNFAHPYDGSTYFYNDSKMLGCENISFASLRTDVMDWFCTDISDVEGVYLATVIGPRNRYSDAGELTADFRLMSADNRDREWHTYMSPSRQFDDGMFQEMYEHTNALLLNHMTEFENPRGRITCMFNLPVLSGCSTENGFLGDSISAVTPPSLYLDTYSALSDDAYLSKTYNALTFSDVRRINAVEMPFAFCGLSSATFGNLRTISPSAVMAYGAFMNCSAATFDRLESVAFMQNGLDQPDTMLSRFAPSGNEEVKWYGNYCNMFAGCSSATFGSLSSVMLNSLYASFGQAGDRVLTWFDTDGELNYMTYTSFFAKFTFTFYINESGNIHVSVSDADGVKFFDYDTLHKGSESSGVDVRFFAEVLGSSEILVKITITPLESVGGEPFVFCITTDGFTTINPVSPSPIDRYAAELAGTEKIYSIGGENGLETPRHIVFYRNATGYHTIEVDSEHMMDLNYKVAIATKDGQYVINVYDNNAVGQTLLTSFQTGVEVDKTCSFRLEMSEINYELAPIVVITDAKGSEHLYEILPGAEVETLTQHPRTGVVEPLGYSTTACPFMSSGRYIGPIEYRDIYGQNYDITTGYGGDGTYRLLLCDDNGYVVSLGTPADMSSQPPSSVKFDVGSYLSYNGLCCIIVGIADDAGHHVFYKIYKDYAFGKDGSVYKFVEQTHYDPMVELEYRHLFDMDIGKSVPLSHRCYCSGMFMDCVSAQFDRVDTICLPSVGSCAGMFAGCESLNTSSLRYMVLPSSDTEGVGGYSNVFGGLELSSVNFEGLTLPHTNIHQLGLNGAPTYGPAFFGGMLDGGVAVDKTGNDLKALVANRMGLSDDILSKMVWE